MATDQPHRKVYSKGFFDGLRAAGADAATHPTGDDSKIMNPARFQSILNGQTSIAQKVFASVPINEEWSATAIRGELIRTGTTMDVRTLEGCLAALKQAGLVREPRGGHYLRAFVKEKPAKAEAPPIATEATAAAQPHAVAKPATTSAIDKLSTLADRVRAMMDGLKTLAADIETAALEIEDQMASNAEEIARIKQFKALLNQIG